MAVLVIIFQCCYSWRLLEIQSCMYLTFCALQHNKKFFLAPLFMLVWPTVKITRCIINTLLCSSPDSTQAVLKMAYSD